MLSVMNGTHCRQITVLMSALRLSLVAMALSASMMSAKLGATTDLLAQTPRYDYHLRPQQIAQNTWVLIGAEEDFSRENGANIVNIAFIVTQAGVVLIDTGPSLRYAQQLAAAIKTVTDKPVVATIITHHHPDHWFGNQFFADTPIYALPQTIADMRAQGDAFADNLYRMAGDWMRSTEPTVASHPIEQERLTFGEHTLRLIALKGHTSSDLAIYDETSQILFAGDILFNQRAPTTPHAHIEDWINAIDQLSELDFKWVVPGHGPVSRDDRPFTFTQNHLRWLNDLMVSAARRGDTMTDVMQAPIPSIFSDASLMREELTRSVTHLYDGYEMQHLKPVADGEY